VLEAQATFEHPLIGAMTDDAGEQQVGVDDDDVMPALSGARLELVASDARLERRRERWDDEHDVSAREGRRPIRCRHVSSLFDGS
jgi:hypothetical protein